MKKNQYISNSNYFIINELNSVQLNFSTTLSSVYRDSSNQEVKRKIVCAVPAARRLSTGIKDGVLQLL